jgi:hypothetical protein
LTIPPRHGILSLETSLAESIASPTFSRQGFMRKIRHAAVQGIVLSLLTMTSCALPTLPSPNPPATHYYYLTSTGGGVSFRGLVSFPAYFTDYGAVNGLAMAIQDNRTGTGVGGMYSLLFVLPHTVTVPMDLPVMDVAGAGVLNAAVSFQVNGKNYTKNTSGSFHFETWSQTSAGITFTCTFTFTGTDEASGETISITDGKVAQE